MHNKKVADVLREHVISQSEYGIKNLIDFKSGAAFISILEESSEKFRAKLPELGLQIKQTQPRLVHTFRIHNIPGDSHEDEVLEDIILAFELTAMKIELVNYSNRKLEGSKLAIVAGDMGTLQAAEN